MNDDSDHEQVELSQNSPDDSVVDEVYSGESVEPANEEDASLPKELVDSQVLAQAMQELMDIRSILERRLSYDKAKELAFNRLYMELDDIKRDRFFEENRSLFIDLMLLYDRLETAKTQYSKGQLSDLVSFQDELLEIMIRRDIKMIDLVEDIFNPTIQKAVGTENVRDPDKHRKVLRIVRNGFYCGSRVLRPQDVVVGRFKPDPRAVQDEDDKDSADERDQKGDNDV